MIGPDAMKGRTPALKICLVRIQPGKEDESIQSLLALLSDVHRNIDQFTVTIVPDNFRTNAANSRILLCALWQLKPRSCVGAQEPYTLKDLSNNLEGEVTAKKATYSLVRKAKNSEAGLIIRLRIGYEEEVELFDFLFDFGFAENVVRAEIDYSDPFSIPRQQDVADAWLKSHCLNVGVLTQLLSGDEQDFLRARSALLEQLVTEFVSTNTAWDFEDTPPLGSLFFEDEEEDDSDIDEDENEVDDGIHA